MRASCAPQAGWLASAAPPGSRSHRVLVPAKHASIEDSRTRYLFFRIFICFSLTSIPPATCRCVFPPWITSSTAWRLNSSLYLRAILLFTVAFILLCALVSAQLGEVQTIIASLPSFGLQSFFAALVVELALDVPFPQKLPKLRPRLDRQLGL